MKKIPSVFLRNPENMHELTHMPNPAAQWVFDGEGLATRKYDGTCVMFDGESWWARREVKKGKTDPEGFVSLGEDPNTGKRMGWLPSSPQGYLHPLLDALKANVGHTWAPGTYELCGPKINGNPEKLERHDLLSHDRAEVLELDPRDKDYVLFKDLLINHVGSYLGWEGLVWHHPDGRMAKLKVRDFE